MTKKAKAVVFSAGGIIGLLILLIILRSILFGPYTKGIPDIPESLSLSEVVLDQIQEASSSAKRWPSADNLGKLGMVYHSSANYEEAASAYKLAITRDPEAWIWNYYLGYLYLEMGDSDGVTAFFNKVITSVPDIHLAWYYCGEQYRNLGEYELAETCFNRIKSIPKSTASKPESGRVDYFPLGTYARFQLARMYMDSDRRDMSESMLKGILLASPTFGPAYRLLGNLYRMEGNLSLSEKYGVRANDLLLYTPPVDALVDKISLLSRSELYLLKKIDEAIDHAYGEWASKLVMHGMEYIPENKDLLSKAITVSLWLNHTDRVNTYTDQHIQFFQEDFDEMQHVGNLFFEKELYPQARLYYAKALLLKPGDAHIQEKLAVCLWHEGEGQQSLDLLSALVESQPDNMELLAEVTEILLFELDQSQMAIQYLVVLDHFLPSNPKVRKMTAWVAQNKGLVEEAIAMYELSFQGDPDDLATSMNLGNLLISQNMWAKSISHYQLALEHHPNEPLFLEKLASLLINCPDPSYINYEVGKEYAERAFIHVESPPRTAIAAGRSLAIAYANLGQVQHARLVINQTMDMARRANFSETHMAVLENLSLQLTKLPSQ